jgi:hypothetical protein
MLKIDTIKLKAPIDTLRDFNPEQMDFDTKKRGDKLVKSQYLKTNIGVGFKTATIDTLDNSVLIEISAKILAENYYSLINQNTIEQAIDTINTTGVVNLDRNQFIDTAQIMRCDITQNLHPSQKIENYFTALSMLPITDKYNVAIYKNGGVKNNGIVISGKQKTFKERQIFYNKLTDVWRDKELKRIIDQNTLLNQFKGVLRVETNFTQHRKIKEYCGGSNNLIDVLKAQTNPNYQIFKKITKQTPDTGLTLFEKYEGMKLYEVEKIEGRKQIIKNLNNDIGLIKEFLGRFSKGNLSRTIAEYRQLINELVPNEIKEQSMIDEIIYLMSNEPTLKVA